jgi:hypothetical protein
MPLPSVQEGLADLEGLLPRCCLPAVPEALRGLEGHLYRAPLEGRADLGCHLSPADQEGLVDLGLDSGLDLD